MMEVRLSQKVNTSFPMLVTLLGILMAVKLQPVNAELPILFVLDGIETEAKLPQS